MQSPTTTATGAVAADETDRLISSDKVVGTAVYKPPGRAPRLSVQSHDRQALRPSSLCRDVVRRLSRHGRELSSSALAGADL